MKKLLMMATALMVSMASVTFTACGDDDDEVAAVIDDLVNGETSAKITEDGNTVTLTTTQKGAYTCTDVATFNDNDLCQSYVQTWEYTATALADAAYSALKEADGQDGVTVTRDGKKIVVEYTGMYQGVFTRQMIKEMFQSRANRTNDAN